MTAHETCDKLVNAVKSSNLHFVLQETPHSVYITIRKKFVIKINDDIIINNDFDRLETKFDNLKQDYEKKIASHEETLQLVKILEDKLEKVEANYIRVSNKLNTGKEGFLKEKNTHKKDKHKGTELKKIEENWMK